MAFAPPEALFAAEVCSFAALISWLPDASGAGLNERGVQQYQSLYALFSQQLGLIPREVSPADRYEYIAKLRQ